MSPTLLAVMYSLRTLEQFWRSVPIPSRYTYLEKKDSAVNVNKILKTQYGGYINILPCPEIEKLLLGKNCVVQRNNSTMMSDFYGNCIYSNKFYEKYVYESDYVLSFRGICKVTSYVLTEEGNKVTLEDVE